MNSVQWETLQKRVRHAVKVVSDLIKTEAYAIDLHARGQPTQPQVAKSPSSKNDTSLLEAHVEGVGRLFRGVNPDTQHRYRRDGDDVAFDTVYAPPVAGHVSLPDQVAYPDYKKDLTGDGCIESQPGPHYNCASCQRSWNKKGEGKKPEKCLSCNKIVSATGPADGNKTTQPRQKKNDDLINKSLREETSKMLGEADALKEKMDDSPAVNIPPPPYERSAVYFMLSPNTRERPRYKNILRCLIFAFTICVYGFFCPVYCKWAWNDGEYTLTNHFIAVCVCLVLVKKHTYHSQNFLRFTLVESTEILEMNDMRPDSMGHTKMKHNSCLGVVKVDRVADCHIRDHPMNTVPTQLVKKFIFLVCQLVLGHYMYSGESLTVDMEVFSQILPSLVMTPAKTSVDRIDNHISRLSSVNVNRRDSTPVLSNTCIYLKAYHWHHVALKEDIGYFSPYELILPIRE
jgi:hypothetical protein